MGEDHIHRQNQVVDRGEMDREVGQQGISFAGRHGKSCLFHLVEHLGEDSEVEAWRPEGQIAKSSQASGEDQKEEGTGEEPAFGAVTAGKNTGINSKRRFLKGKKQTKSSKKDPCESRCQSGILLNRPSQKTVEKQNA